MKDETEVGKSYRVLSLDYRAGTSTERYRGMEFEFTCKEGWDITGYKEKEEAFLGKRKNTGKGIKVAEYLGCRK